MKVEHNYKCDGHCNEQGCQGHNAVLEFHSTSNTYHFNDGNSIDIWFDRDFLWMFEFMLSAMNRRMQDGSIKLRNNFPKDLLQEHLGYFIYSLGEENFNCIKNEFLEKHINENERFNDKQLNEFAGLISSFIDDLKQ